MKHSYCCPKCESSNILKIKGGSTWTGYQNFIMANSFNYVLVTRYLCGKCGFSEEWVDDPKGLKKLNKKFGGSHQGGHYV